MFRLILVVFLVFQIQIEAFNLSPYPNQVIKYQGHPKQSRSSYFGYSLVIRQKRIFVGAPRAQSTFQAQSNIEEPGMIYRCSLENQNCQPYALDSKDNEDSYDTLFLGSKHKDFQWLGASMDGGTQDTDKLLVCAPRFYTHSWDKDELPVQYHMLGICYWVKNTVNDIPLRVMEISPLRDPKIQEREIANVTHWIYSLGQLGLSGHVSDNGSKFLIGAPGIDDWKGTVILNQEKENEESSARAQRDTSRALFLKRAKRSVSRSDTVAIHPNGTQQDDSYFGYAVSSGYFDSLNTSHLLYVATAPQANNQSGEAYIFDVRGESIQKYKVFRGDQFGEYFGYSVLAEDLNGDGKTDLIISAPFHALNDSYDNGVIYVFINNGLLNFTKTIIKSPAGCTGRFGATLSRLGDINDDGYNDVAVGAPFAGNGSVFIYMGGEFGLRDQPSQRLDAPSQQPSKYGSHMFGHGLSRGLDIDGNGFNDFAIGAPNAEVVYLYRAYPIVKILATVKSESWEIKPDQEKVKITACYRLNTTAMALEVQKQQELNIRIAVDTKLKRVKFVQTQTNEMRFKAKAGIEEQCQVFEAQVRNTKKDMFTPIELEMHYELTNKVSVSGEFCETCVAVDPAEPKVYTEKINIAVYTADLRLRSKNVSLSFILGSSDTIRLSYEITNNGETAYLPQFNVTSTPRLAFAQLPGNCRVGDYDDQVMVCDLNRGGPLAKGDSDSVTISFDVSQFSGQSLSIHAEVSSVGKEKNPTDNKQSVEISLEEIAEIDVSGRPADGQIALKCSDSSAEVMNSYKIRSRGPSIIEQLTLSVYIPIAFKMASSEAFIPIVNVTSLKMQATYNARPLPIKLYDHNNALLDTFPIGNSSQSEVYNIQPRKRRDLQGLLVNQTKEAGFYLKRLFNKPSLNRSIALDCRETNLTICVRAEISVKFWPSEPISLNISFNVDLKDIEEPWDYFVIQTDVKLLKEDDPTSSSIVIHSLIQPNVLYKHAGLSIWKIIMAVIGGGLILAAITYGFHKFGFFKRTMRYEIARIIRSSFEEELAEAEALAEANSRANSVAVRNERRRQ
ncbi:integrin alpha-PS3-like [Drosophila rhopaloa]|uniref:Integrin alpha-PS3-like n=1 Tax=Drosophila rhopaloa TaxID=1041015 RepID=A0A6P4EGH0_DRORH|nr:integrin alpha-PS3-like [Drosophila rhopaloa]